MRRKNVNYLLLSDSRVERVVHDALIAIFAGNETDSEKGGKKIREKIWKEKIFNLI